jgi:hypothetical protein
VSAPGKRIKLEEVSMLVAFTGVLETTQLEEGRTTKAVHGSFSFATPSAVSDAGDEAAMLHVEVNSSKPSGTAGAMVAERCRRCIGFSTGTAAIVTDSPPFDAADCAPTAKVALAFAVRVSRPTISVKVYIPGWNAARFSTSVVGTGAPERALHGDGGEEAAEHSQAKLSGAPGSSGSKLALPSSSCAVPAVREKAATSGEGVNEKVTTFELGEQGWELSAKQACTLTLRVSLVRPTSLQLSASREPLKGAAPDESLQA